MVSPTIRLQVTGQGNSSGVVYVRLPVLQGTNENDVVIQMAWYNAADCAWERLCDSTVRLCVWAGGWMAWYDAADCALENLCDSTVGLFVGEQRNGRYKKYAVMQIARDKAADFAWM